MNRQLLNITLNENEVKRTLMLETTPNANNSGSFEIMLIETPEKLTDECQRTFLRITHHTNTIEICMAINGLVETEEKPYTKVPGFPQSVKIYLPEYLLPVLKKAINSIV